MHNAIGGGSPVEGKANLYQSIGSGGGGLGSVPNLEEELSIDKSTMETLKAIYAAKERAV